MRDMETSLFSWITLASNVSNLDFLNKVEKKINLWSWFLKYLLFISTEAPFHRFAAYLFTEIIENFLLKFTRKLKITRIQRSHLNWHLKHFTSCYQVFWIESHNYSKIKFNFNNNRDGYKKT